VSALPPAAAPTGWPVGRGPIATARNPATARNLVAMAARLWRLRVSGAHQVPVAGPALLAANHCGLLDGPVLVAASPRPVHVLAKSTLFVGPWASLLRAAGQVEIDYDGPDRSALQECLRLLEQGRAVGIFPEAHRGRGDVAHIHHGVAYLAVSSGAPVVPVAVLGTRRSGAPLDSVPPPRSAIDVVFGEPVSVAGGDPRRRAVLAGAGERIRQALADHVASSCRRAGRTLPDLPDGGGDD
jgi:1-acyl-sn-glycerol-3-phosphate acyltransferase